MDISKKLEKIERLPTLPQISQRILNALEEEVSAQKLEEIISEDQSLAARLLKLANSPIYRGAQPVTNLRQAVVRLGTGEVRNVVLTAALKYMLKPTATYKKFDITRLWIHALAVARAVYLLASEEGHPDPNTVYTAGLLHDIGRLAIAVFFPEEFLHILALCEAKGISFHEAEKELGIDHAAIGAEVAAKWRFSEVLIEAIRWHHTPKNEQGLNQTAFLVFKADIVARIVGLSPEENFQKLPKWPAGLPLDKKILSKVVGILKKEKDDLIASWQDVLNA